MSAALDEYRLAIEPDGPENLQFPSIYVEHVAVEIGIQPKLLSHLWLISQPG
jgi:hypothetical protein